MVRLCLRKRPSDPARFTRVVLPGTRPGPSSTALNWSLSGCPTPRNWRPFLHCPESTPDTRRPPPTLTVQERRGRRCPFGVTEGACGSALCGRPACRFLEARAAWGRRGGEPGEDHAVTRAASPPSAPSPAPQPCLDPSPGALLALGDITLSRAQPVPSLTVKPAGVTRTLGPASSALLMALQPWLVRFAGPARRDSPPPRNAQLSPKPLFRTGGSWPGASPQGLRALGLAQCCFLFGKQA